MVRIIPNRLKPGNGTSAASSTANSRSASPLRGGKATTNKDTGLCLHVVIMKARNLAAKDRSGSSDPVSRGTKQRGMT